MLRLIGALILVLLIVTPTLGQQSLVGTYKIISQDLELDGIPQKAPGKTPNGYFILTPSRAIQFYTIGDRKFGTSVEEKATLFDRMVAWSAVYRVEGDKIIYTYDASWVEHLNGTTGVYRWKLSGNRLTLITDPRPWPQNPSKTMVLRRVWEKIE